MNTNVAGTVEISLSTNWKRSGRQIWRYLKNSPPASKTCQVVGNRCRIILKRLIRQRCQQWLVSAAPGLEQFGALPPTTPKRSNSWLLANEPAPPPPRWFLPPPPLCPKSAAAADSAPLSFSAAFPQSLTIIGLLYYRAKILLLTYCSNWGN